MDTNRTTSVVRRASKLIPVVSLAMGLSAAALAQQQQPAPMAPARAEAFITAPTGTTITNFYKQNVYDPADNKIGDVNDVLIDKQGQVTALMIGVGGFLGMGEKDVAVPFSSIRANVKDNKWYLVLDTTKEALKTAPGFKYDKAKTTWVKS
jgi:sporulation protein YlmC with PRC-barrel domain